MLARAARARCRCGLVGSIVLRATFSPAAAQLQLLVVRLLAAFCVLHICGATGHCWPHAAVLAPGLCWCLDVMDCSIVMSETQSSLIIVPGFICKSVVACWHNQHEGWLHQRVWRAQPPDLADFSCTWRTASSRSSVWCVDRRRRLYLVVVLVEDFVSVLLSSRSWRQGSCTKPCWRCAPPPRCFM